MIPMSVGARLLLVTVCLTAGTLAGCAAHLIPVDDAAIDRLPGDKLIVPGERVGPFRLYATVDETVLKNGPWDYAARFVLNPWTLAQRDFERRTWRRYGISVYYSEHDPRAQVLGIFVFSPKWRTASGVAIGSVFRDALGGIRQTTVSGFIAQCSEASAEYPAQCNAYDVGGMKISTFDKRLSDAPITDLWVFAPGEAYTPLNHP
jgi:hypothetical protein